MATIYKWEYHIENPHPRRLAHIVNFLGYKPDLFVRRYYGEKILAYRNLHGMSRTELALMLGVHSTTLGQWERNERRPSKEFVETLSLVLNGTSPKQKKNDG